MKLSLSVIVFWLVLDLFALRIFSVDINFSLQIYDGHYITNSRIDDNTRIEVKYGNRLWAVFGLLYHLLSKSLIASSGERLR